METPTLERKLAAILFADIVGYTSTMQSDEKQALQIVERFQNILESVSAKHSGHVIKSYGDGSLLTFKNSLDATKASIEIQQQCYLTPAIDLRIGIHVGEFVTKDGDIFGNGVNLASRVESLGIAGSILLSEAVYLKIKNRPEFKFHPLGSIEFKNVEKPIEIYAIANEGLQVPKRSDLSGKTKKVNKKKTPKWLLAASVLLVFVIGVFGLKTFLGNPNPDEMLAESARAQSLVVSVFTNQTMNPDMDAFGSMISDWLTNGLKETGETNIINIANLPQTKDNQELVLGQEVSSHIKPLIDLILKGRYYLNEGRLLVSAELVDVKTGISLRSFSVERAKGELTDILSELTQQVQTYWSIKESNRFLQNPPSYAAYEDWKKAQPLLLEDPENAILFLKSAFEKDTTFYSPLFSLYGIFTSSADSARANEIFAIMEKRVVNFTKFESLNYEYYKARRAGDLKLAAALSARMFEMDKTDYNANNRAAALYGQINQPLAALEVFEKFDDRFLENETRLLSWRETYKVFPYFLLRRYDEVCRIAEEYNFPKISDALAVIHMKSLVRLDSIQLLERKFQYYKQEGLYSNAGRAMPLDFDIILVCDELYLLNKKETLIEFTKILEKWCVDNPDSPDLNRNMGYVHFYRDEWNRALVRWSKEITSFEFLPGWLAISQEYDRRSRIASLQARQGQEKIARQVADELKTTIFDDTNLRGVPQYYSARILLALGDEEGAIVRLRLAIDNGFSFFRPAVFDSDPMLKELLGKEAFEEMIRPKG